MSSRVIAADQVISILEGFDGPDLDFVLSVLDSRFPRGNRSSKNNQGRGRGGGSGRMGGRGRGGRGNVKNVASPSIALATQPVNNNLGLGRGSGQTNGFVQIPPPKAAAVVVPEENVLMDVLQGLQGIIPSLPEVGRDPSADKPVMTRKSVQTRLNKKRAGLQKVLGLFSKSSVDKYWCFESLNAIQKFRLAAADANATVGVRLRTNPLPKNFLNIIAPMEAMILERTEKGQTSVCGYFRNEDRLFCAPMEQEKDGVLG